MSLSTAESPVDTSIGGSTVKKEIENHAIDVLVVEDNYANQVLIERMLNRIGCQVTIAENGRVALAKLDQKQFDIIFMDCQMPVLNGYETTTHIRNSSGQNRKTPIVAVTANSIPDNRKKCLAIGMDDFVSKPILPGFLEAMLQKWVTGVATVNN